ncbi:hypothetical protein EV385_4364 [Krasilnikovia cinnamomea]|uniref:MYXO-CTERM domain-containing protein n=1 Tax=Krasilnikovia cinnamomea TaxID=349313 RepID=A0A4Q7ZN94_9ACTN|nr:hypothetical protein [Krasilnikovia cinnamomea]RZU52498.1 hypothetical protein EV385_4364 [Krasilnikovia cinnamomea]
MRRFVAAAALPLSLGVLALLAVSTAGAPALAQGVFVETNPSTARAGDEIAVRASCTDNLQAAAVSSSAFATVTAAPNYGFLTATVRVPPATPPGAYEVRLACPDGKKATGTLHVVTKVEPSHGPATGGGGTAADRAAPALVGGGVAAVVAGLIVAVAAWRRRAY